MKIESVFILSCSNKNIIFAVFFADKLLGDKDADSSKKVADKPL